MLRLSRLALADVTINSSTASVSGRLIRIRKKAKWIDRRSKRIPNNGKDVWNFGEQPSCELCHVRFRYKQDFEAHKDSELHQNRQRWAETMTWWKETGEPSYVSQDDKEWAWFQANVLAKKAEELGVSPEDAARQLRQAKMIETPRWHRSIQPPPIKKEIREPRDQRWPSSPKW